MMERQTRTGPQCTEKARLAFCMALDLAIAEMNAANPSFEKLTALAALADACGNDMEMLGSDE